jgi:hypothetical protein
VSAPSPCELGVPISLNDNTVVIVRIASPILSRLLLTLQKHDLDPEDLAGTKPALKLPSLIVPATARSTQPTVQYEELCCALLATWPNEGDLNLILSIPVEITRCLHGLIPTPHSSTQSQKAPSPQEMLQLPPPGSHPVLIALKLLILSSYLQSFSPCSIQNLDQLGVNYRDIMSRAVDTVHSLVNCNDELVASIEGIACIMIESLYYNNAGNLRRSWVTMRRAMLIAQMLNLHRGRTLPSTMTLERQTSIRPEYVWFRLVQSDRYLSMMLGLPQGVPENGLFCTAKELEVCTPMERLQRIHCDVGGRILKRNEADINDLAATQEIDKLLQTASMSMPPQWWLIPNLAPSACDKMEQFHETNRIMDQFTHYHLVAWLHLPYLLRSLADGKYEYSKITAVSASREVLTRFMALRGSNLIGSYCRGIDFLVFIASTTLCLAHIHARHGQFLFGDGEDGFFINYLAHQRPSDRGMMEHALESVEHMASASPDIIAAKISTIFRHLLSIEADAFDGSSYTSSTSGEEELECSGGLSDGGNVLRIYIPSFGTIKIERGGVSRSVLTMPSHEVPASSVSEAQSTNSGVSLSTYSLLAGQDEIRPPQNILDSPTRYSIGDQSINPEWQAVPLHFGQLVPPQHAASATKDQSISTNYNDCVQVNQPLALGLEVGEEDWTLQGVDTALFDSLFRGSEMDAVEMSHWTQ